jgi:hypothetical protein
MNFEEVAREGGQTPSFPARATNVCGTIPELKYLIALFMPAGCATGSKRLANSKLQARARRS